MSKKKSTDLGGLDGLARLSVTKELSIEVAEAPIKSANEPGDALPNLGWAYYIGYFNDLTRDNVQVNPQSVVLPSRKAKNEVLLGADLSKYIKYAVENPAAVQKFTLRTTYPGLLVGSGYQHETGADEELKMGFFFDYSSGLPVIPGSSIKGMLRAAFDPAHRELLRAILLAGGDDIAKVGLDLNVLCDNLKTWRDLIFGYDAKTQEKIAARDTPPFYQRDVFFDAVPLITPKKATKQNPVVGKSLIFGNDYITPHRNPFADPIPLQFMKVLPKVAFEFRFDLKPSISGDHTLSPAQKEAIFRVILLYKGIGAKTNVGYGQFSA